MTYRVTTEWVGLKRNTSFPSIDFLHPRSFSVDWDSCVLVRALHGGAFVPTAAIEFEFVGKKLRKDATVCDAGGRLSAVPPHTLLSLSCPVIQRTFERGTAVIYNGIQPWTRAGAVFFRTIAVPFGNSENELRYVLCAVSHKLSAENVPAERLYTEFLEYRDGTWLPVEDEKTDRRLVIA